MLLFHMVPHVTAEFAESFMKKEVIKCSLAHCGLVRTGLSIRSWEFYLALICK